MVRHLGVLVGLAACTAPFDTTSSSTTSSDTTNLESAVTTPGPVEICPPDYCGGNSPLIAGMGLWEISVRANEPNAQGFVFLGISEPAGNVPLHFLQLGVHGSAFVARDLQGNEVRGTNLRGYTLWLGNGGSQYGVVIAAVGQVHEIVAPYGSVETYVLRWSTVTRRPLPGSMNSGDSLFEPPVLDPDEAFPVCPSSQFRLDENNRPVPVPFHDGPLWPASDYAWDESTVLDPFNAVVFEGDRIDAVTRTVKQLADDRWFNIGCARHTLAKMRLTRNTLHTGRKGATKPELWGRAQATLKMLSADYCGTGTALTVAGTPLLWRETPVGMTYWNAPESLEARWDENGATCIGTPRLVLHPSDEVLHHLHVSSLEQAFAQACRSPDGTPRLPRQCADTDPLRFGNETITSANWNPQAP